MGEGAGILVLEELEHARKARGCQDLRRGRAGYGATCDAHHITAPDPTGGLAGGLQAMQFCPEPTPGIAPEQVGYVNAHGTSTPLNDTGETAALKKPPSETTPPTWRSAPPSP